MRATPERTTTSTPSAESVTSSSNGLRRSLRATQSALRRSQRDLHIRNCIAEIFLTLPSDEMYGEVLHVVLEALASKYGIFGYVDEAGDLVCPSLTREVWQECRVSDKTTVFRRKTWSGMWGEALQRQKVLRSNGPFTVPQGHIPIERAIAAPIVFRGDTIGVLHVADKATDYDDADEELLRTIARHVAPILHARLQSERGQRELVQHRDHLEEMVEERTAELKSANERLYREIEERKRVEEALRESEQRFRQVLELSSDLIYRLDFESRTYDYVSPSVLRLSGFTEKEFAALGIHGIRHRVHPEDWPEFKRKLEEALEPRSDDGEARGREYRWQCKDGQYRWFHESVAFVRGNDGRLLAMVGTVRDITERRQPQEALRQSEQRLSRIFQTAPVCTAITRIDDGRFIDVNESFLDLLGYDREEVIGWTSTDLGLWAEPVDRDLMLQALLQGETVRDFESKVRRKSGEIRDTLSSFVSVDIGGQLCVVGMFTDTTQRKQTEQCERRLHEQEAHTRELRAAVQALERMAATLGHELRNPLGVISNSAYFLSNQAAIDDPRARKHAEIIGREVQSATRVIDDILEFAHVPQIVTSPASLNAIIDQALARSQIPANVRLARRLASDLPPLICDAERLERAFLDIIANAIQAMPHGGSLSVKTQPVTEGVRVIFCDTGEGIAPHNLPKVFDPMFTTKLRGIGLGLTVVRRTVEQHGGQVELKGKLARGTSVMVTLPLTPVDSASGDGDSPGAPGHLARP